MSATSVHSAQEISPDLIDRACQAALATPDLREDRVSEARVRLDAGLPDSHEIAVKIVSRMLSDSLR